MTTIGSQYRGTKQSARLFGVDSGRTREEARQYEDFETNDFDPGDYEPYH